MQVHKQIFITTLLLLISILFFGISSIDIDIQNLFYNNTEHLWILAKYTEPYHFIFYTFTRKIPLVLFIILVIVLLIFHHHAIVQHYKKRLIIVLLSIVFVPAISVGIKNSTNIPCPKHLQYYNGQYPHTAIWETYTTSYKNLKSQHCWPAGHASGGFALMSLFFLFKRKRIKRIALGSTFILGWLMGMYKMMIGDHFFSHTFITMLLSWLIILIIAKCTNKFIGYPATPLHNVKPQGLTKRYP